MVCSVRPFAAALLGGFILMSAATGGAWAQSAPADQKAAEQKSPEEQAKEEAQRRSVEEYAKAAKLPDNASLPECVWSGRRIAMLL